MSNRFVATLVCLLAAAPLPAQSIRTIAGTGTAGHSGDGGPGVRAQVANPYGVQIGPDGALYICDIDNHRVRRLDLRSDEISTVAGSGKEGYSGDGGPPLKVARRFSGSCLANGGTLSGKHYGINTSTTTEVRRLKITTRPSKNPPR